MWPSRRRVQFPVFGPAICFLICPLLLLLLVALSFPRRAPCPVVPPAAICMTIVKLTMCALARLPLLQTGCATHPLPYPLLHQPHTSVSSCTPCKTEAEPRTLRTTLVIVLRTPVQSAMSLAAQQQEPIYKADKTAENGRLSCLGHGSCDSQVAEEKKGGPGDPCSQGVQQPLDCQCEPTQQISKYISATCSLPLLVVWLALAVCCGCVFAFPACQCLFGRFVSERSRRRGRGIIDIVYGR